MALVEDRADVRQMLQKALASAGFRVRVFASGDEAGAMSDEELGALAAVVSDVVMPGTSGIALARALRWRRPGLPTVLVSGDLSEHVRATLPDDALFLQKPFTLSELVACLRAVMRR